MLKKCFIPLDLAKEQQALDKELRTEVKKLSGKGKTDVKIKRGTVVKTPATGEARGDFVPSKQ